MDNYIYGDLFPLFDYPVHDDIMIRRKKIPLPSASSTAPCTIVQGAVDKTIGRGRPRTSWLGNIKKWTGRTAIEIHCATQNQKEWRKITFGSSHARPRRPIQTRDW